MIEPQDLYPDRYVTDSHFIEFTISDTIMDDPSPVQNRNEMI